MRNKTLGIICAAALACACSKDKKTTTDTESSETAGHSAKAEGYVTPQQASDALIAAASTYDVPAMLKILGPEGKDLVASADTVQDKQRATAFAEKAREKYHVVIDPEDQKHATLLVGNSDWPLPIPLVKDKDRWYFDAKSGHDEILRRRVGANELDVIVVARGFVEAQKEYAADIHDDSGVHQYAQRIVSTPGKHDGLAWQNADGSWAGPVGPGVAKALEQGYKTKEPFHGYYFKVLKGQGASAPIGRLDYMVGGSMIGGFALVAWPAEYGVTGVQTFIVSHDGIVHQKDLGKDTTSLVEKMDLYDPDPSWTRTNDAA